MVSKFGETRANRALKDCKEFKIIVLKLSARRILVSLLTMLYWNLWPLNILMNIYRSLYFSSITIWVNSKTFVLLFSFFYITVYYRFLSSSVTNRLNTANISRVTSLSLAFLKVLYLPVLNLLSTSLGPACIMTFRLVYRSEKIKSVGTTSNVRI